jgi:hypothetical protein
MATRHSSRSRPSSRARSKPQPPPAAITREVKSTAGGKKPTRPVARSEFNKKKAKLPDLGTILDHFSDSLALVETAYAVLNTAQDNWDADCCGSDISPAVLTLELGVKKLQGLRGDLDLAILPPRQR